MVPGAKTASLLAGLEDAKPGVGRPRAIAARRVTDAKIRAEERHAKLGAPAAAATQPNAISA